MFHAFFAKLWHQKLGRPFRLAKIIDQGGGTPVVLLHGVGSSARVWEHLIATLLRYPYRVVAYDLLGFGDSPKPTWLDYDVDDHARAVIASIEKLNLPEPAIIVGHSMGCLVAVRVARLRPDLARHLILFEMPIYEGLPNKRRYRLRLNLYLKFYEAITLYQPTFDMATARFSERLATRFAGFELTRDTWVPFIKSLQNTIVRQTTAEDIKLLAMPADVIYGSLDMLVIRGKAQDIFGEDNERLDIHTVRARHAVSPKASLLITDRIAAALGMKP